MHRPRGRAVARTGLNPEGGRRRQSLSTRAMLVVRRDVRDTLDASHRPAVYSRGDLVYDGLEI
jgi:hypothetical protein